MSRKETKYLTPMAPVEKKTNTTVQVVLSKEQTKQDWARNILNQ